MDPNKLEITSTGKEFYPLDCVMGMDIEYTYDGIPRLKLDFILPDKELIKAIEGKLKAFYIRID